jgi:RHS repeat-associated protein
MLGNMGLVHMNGRVEDAVTGRFLSADPYVSEPNNTQNFNRYGYVYNNPLSYIDPSGFCTAVTYTKTGTTTFQEVDSEGNDVGDPEVHTTHIPVTVYLGSDCSGGGGGGGTHTGAKGGGGDDKDPPPKPPCKPKVNIVKLVAGSISAVSGAVESAGGLGTATIGLASVGVPGGQIPAGPTIVAGTAIELHGALNVSDGLKEIQSAIDGRERNTTLGDWFGRVGGLFSGGARESGTQTGNDVSQLIEFGDLAVSFTNFLAKHGVFDGLEGATGLANLLNPPKANCGATQ